MRGLMENIDPSVTRKVYPSAAEFASTPAATFPFEPGRLSTRTDWPIRSWSACPTTRATVSGSPPGEYGTMSRTDLFGYADCVCAAPAVAAVTPKATAVAQTKRLDIPFMLLPPSLLSARLRAGLIQRPVTSPGPSRSLPYLVDRRPLLRKRREGANCPSWALFPDTTGDG